MDTEGKATTASVQSTAPLQGIEVFNEMYLAVLQDSIFPFYLVVIADLTVFFEAP